MSIERTNPITGTEAQRRWLQANAATIEAAEEGASIGAQELHTSVDGAGLKRVFRCHENIGRTYHLGTVANEAAMLALDSPLTSHACLPGDTCFRSDTQQIMRCVSNYGVSVGDWEVVPDSGDSSGIAAAAVSAHNTATDSHTDIRTLVADRAPISTTRLGSVDNTPLTTTALSAADWAALPVGWRGIISADVALASGLPAADVYHIQKISNRDVSGGAAYQAQGYLSPTLYVGVAATSSDLPTWSVALTSAPGTTVSAVGASLLSVATPSAPKITRINPDGSVTLINVPSGGGDGGARGLYSGLMSETIPSQSSTGLTTWINQGTASATDTAVGIQIVNPTTSADDNIRGLVMPVPTTPYTLTALLELDSLSGNYPSALLGWADSGSTKTHAVSICGDGRSGLVSPTGYSSWSFSGAPVFTRDGRRVWLQFSDDGTTITVKWSISGVYWHTLFSGAKASSHLGASGYNRLFFGASSSGITGVATLLSWLVS